MKARNNYNDGLTNDYQGSNYYDVDNFTPVNKKKRSEMLVAPNLSSNKEETEENMDIVHKRLRRNLNALGETVSQPILETSPVRKQNILQSHRPKRDLSKLGDDIENEQRIQYEKQEKFPKRVNHYQKYSVPEKPIPQKPVDLNNSSLFPSLGNSLVEIKKISAWNVFNPTLLQTEDKSIPKLVEKKIKISRPVNNSVSVNNSVVVNSVLVNSVLVNSVLVNSDSEDYDDSNDYDNYIEEDDAENNDEEDTEDSEEAYMREQYYKHDQLLDDIEYVKKNYNKYNKDHVRFLHQLECDFAEIEDEIYRYQQLENEMEKNYGPYYRNQSSILDEKKRIEEEEKSNKENLRKLNEYMKY